MIVTCPQCQTQYELTPEQLGAGGRTVRCTTCSHMWFEMPQQQAAAVPPPPPPAPPVTAAPPPPVATAPVEVAPPPPPSAKPIQEALGTLMNQDAAVFDAVLSSVGDAAAKKAAEEAQANKPKPLVRHQASLAAITHDPMGVGANAFGFLVFFLCTSLTFLFIFLAQKPILRYVPQMAFLYRELGFHVMAPGEGLRIRELAAEQRGTGKEATLALDGKVVNVSEHDIVYPALRVVLKNDESGIMKKWNFDAGTAIIASGEVAPIMLQLPDAPKDGTVIEVYVRD